MTPDPPASKESSAAGTRQLIGRLASGAAVSLRWHGDLVVEVAAQPVQKGAGALPWLLPGLVDLQVNGWAGADVNAVQPSTPVLRALVEKLAALGTTRLLPTVITAPPEVMLDRIRAVAAAVREDPIVADAVAGIHVEGPYLSAAEGARGAHDTAAMRDPDPSEVESWLRAANGLLRMVTLAPEREACAVVIRQLVRSGVRVAIGHSAAQPPDIDSAASAGATVSTHLGNGIATMLPRHPNSLWAQLADDRLTAGLIADGHHLPSDTFTTMVRAKGPGGSFLVSDSVALAGQPPGIYASTVGGTVEVTATGALKLPGTGLLAGSGANLLDCLRWASLHTPIPAQRLLAMASITPARLLSQQAVADLSVGARADVLVLEPAPDLRAALIGSPIRETIVAGRRLER